MEETSRPAPGRDIIDAPKAFLLSRTVRSVLRSPFAALPEGVAEPLVDVTSFALTLFANPSISPVVGAIGGLLSAESRVRLTNLSSTRPRARRARMSDGLWQAFEEAQHLRLETGGNDQFVGLRYILLVLLASRREPLRSETEAALRLVEVDRQSAALEVARFCILSREPKENRAVWRAYLTDHGLEAAMAEWDPVLKLPADGGLTTLSEIADFSLVEERAEGAGMQGPSVALLHPDDPWSRKVRDETGAEEEARAFADMVVAKAFDPPLAVGIFGEWGSGKSYFMRQIYEAVPDNRRRYAEARAKEGAITFCQDVIQIRFNAWHYAEANLWPSLVDHILTQLNNWMSAVGPVDDARRLFNSLSTARRLTIDAARDLVDKRRALDAAREKKRQADATLIATRSAAEQTPGTYITAAFASLWEQAGAKEEFEAAAKRFGLADLSKNAEAFQAASAGLGDEVSRLALLRTGAVGEFARWPVALCVVAGVVVLPPLFGALVGTYADASAALGASIAGLLAPITAGLTWATARAKSALDVVSSYRTRFDEAVAQKTQEASVAAAQMAEALAAVEAAAVQAEEALRQAASNEATAEATYKAENGARRILRFVRDRIADGTYAKHLSFIASIRRDFEELTRLLDQRAASTADAELARENHARQVKALIDEAGDLLHEDERTVLKSAEVPADGAEPHMFDRIILYVDDLDRCRPEQVVAVLEAIQLLLNYPIFVVFVAVDVRWLQDALKRQFPQLGPDGKAGPGGCATTTDYLEKIFQIPYWVRPFGETETRAFLRNRLHRDDAAAQGGPGAPDPDQTGQQGDPEPREEPAGSTSGDAAGASQADDGAPSPTSVDLTDAERDIIDKVAPFLTPLPRRALRFLNTYWILKGGLTLGEQRQLEQAGHRAVLALLAIAIFTEDSFPQLVRAICTAAPGEPAIDFATRIAGSLGQDNAKRMGDCLKVAGIATAGELQAHAERVARYSFHQGD